MLALESRSAGSVVVSQVPIPQAGEHEVSIRVLRAGICSTDLETLKGYAEFRGILGHEFVGEVVAFGTKVDPKKYQIGERVVAEINLTCEKCSSCATGGVFKRNHCRKRSVVGIRGRAGCFAEYIVLPSDNLHSVPANISTRAAAFAEPLAAAFRIVEQELVGSKDKIAVIGDGKLGLLITEVLRTQDPSEVVIFGHHQHKLQLLPEDGIEKVTLDKVGVPEEYDGRFDVVVEATGSPDGIMMAAALARPLGTVVLKTTCAAGSTTFNTAPFVVKELKVVGSRCGNFKMALECLKEEKIDVCKYISGEYPLAEGAKAIQRASESGVLKIQLVMGDDQEL